MCKFNWGIIRPYFQNMSYQELGRKNFIKLSLIALGAVSTGCRAGKNQPEITIKPDSPEGYFLDQNWHEFFYQSAEKLTVPPSYPMDENIQLSQPEIDAWFSQLSQNYRDFAPINPNKKYEDLNPELQEQVQISVRDFFENQVKPAMVSSPFPDLRKTGNLINFKSTIISTDPGFIIVDNDSNCSQGIACYVDSNTSNLNVFNSTKAEINAQNFHNLEQIPDTSVVSAAAIIMHEIAGHGIFYNHILGDFTKYNDQQVLWKRIRNTRALAHYWKTEEASLLTEAYAYATAFAVLSGIKNLNPDTFEKILGGSSWSPVLKEWEQLSASGQTWNFDQWLGVINKYYLGK